MAKHSPSFSLRVPPEDTRERRICDHCAFIDYINPRIVAGSVVRHDDRILLCRRDIEPARGFWTLPAGFMETGETVEEAARREAQEEACADIAIDAMLAVYSIPRIAQVQVMFLAHLETPDFAVGPESQEVALFAWDEIPWKELAFPSVKWALNQFDQVRDTPLFAPFGNPEGTDAQTR